MARRKRSNVSSLDLFLDTICNAFGGIMFISILISILIQMRGKDPESSDKREGLSETEAIQKQSQLTELQRQVEIMSQTIADRERLLFNEDSTEARELQSRRDAMRQQLEQMQKVQQTLLGESAKRDREIQTTKQELMDLEQRLRDAKIAVSERSKELDDALDATETTTTMPKVTTTSKGNLLFAMRYGKLYLISDVSGVNANQVNTQHVNATSMKQGVLVTLKDDAGWNLDSADAKIALQDLMRSHPSSTTFFSVAVWPDSFDQFLKWKASLIQQGYDYDLKPIDALESLMIGSSSSATVQ